MGLFAGDRHAGGGCYLSHSGNHRRLHGRQETHPVRVSQPYLWIFTALLFFVEKGDIFTGMLFFILAEIGYRGGQVFYNALLTDIATPDEMGRVSGNGWAIGSVGGIICLLFILPVIVLTDSNPLVVRGSFAFTAVFFILSTLPLFMRLKERGEGRSLPPEKIISAWLSNA